LNEKCDFNSDTIPLYKSGKYATVIHYPSTSDFNVFKGIDLVPENRAYYAKGSEYAKLLNFRTKVEEKIDDLMMHKCTIEHDDRKGGWIVQRIGPFTSRGGYDWWQFGWSNVGQFHELLKSFPDGIDIVNSIITPVHENGTRLGLPPIHVHHIHVVAQNSVRPRNTLRPICVGSSGLSGSFFKWLAIDQNCYNASLFFEQHGKI